MRGAEETGHGIEHDVDRDAGHVRREAPLVAEGAHELARAQAWQDALSDATRRAVFEGLIEGPRSVGEIARGLPVTRPAVSQHLKVLKQAGLVFATRHGTRNLYQVDPAGLEGIRQYFDQFWSRALAAFKDAAERQEEER